MILSNTTSKVLSVRKKHATDLLHEMLTKLTEIMTSEIQEWTFISCSTLNGVSSKNAMYKF